MCSTALTLFYLGKKLNSNVILHNDTWGFSNETNQTVLAAELMQCYKGTILIIVFFFNYKYLLHNSWNTVVAKTQ